MSDEEWVKKIKEEREQKDDFFENHPRSPIPEKRRRDFQGLDYFELKKDYRFKLALKKFNEPEEITVETSTGGKDTYIRFGEFKTNLKGKKITLTAFKSSEDEEHIWVPFKDKTNGEKTYKNGRYIDINPEEHKKGGKWVLDFNRAYNPFCAYNENYECPLVPEENHLEVKVKAGEKRFKE